jgi:hypothetical protein
MDPKPVARFTDAVDKSFSSLHGNEDNILRFFDKTFKEEKVPE